jgi:ApaG protein
MYEKTTQGVRVSVRPEYRADQSNPDEDYYVWAYHVTIRNEGGEAVTLKTRFWRITDARGRVQEVRGAGVVGEQPRLEPGESFEYASGTPLRTSSGFMSGCYQMARDDGTLIEVEIPAFSLDMPGARERVN